MHSLQKPPRDSFCNTPDMPFHSYKDTTNVDLYLTHIILLSIIQKQEENILNGAPDEISPSSTWVVPLLLA
jgi:hypothetical protein